jgi:acetolactate synthase small subunit
MQTTDSRDSIVPKSHMHTLSLVVFDRPGVLVRIALVFARRGYNIASLAVSPGAEGGFSRMTITCIGDPEILEQIIKQLAKLVDVVYITDHTDESPIEREIALIKMRCTLNNRTEILQIAEHYKAKVVDYGAETMILRVEGNSQKLDTFIALLRSYDIEELVRSGKIVMNRGPSQFAHLLTNGS